jgi:hypothetical protein
VFALVLTKTNLAPRFFGFSQKCLRNQHTQRKKLSAPKKTFFYLIKKAKTNNAAPSLSV